MVGWTFLLTDFITFDIEQFKFLFSFYLDLCNLVCTDDMRRFEIIINTNKYHIMYFFFLILLCIWIKITFLEAVGVLCAVPGSELVE